MMTAQKFADFGLAVRVCNRPRRRRMTPTDIRDLASMWAMDARNNPYGDKSAAYAWMQRQATEMELRK